jgi:signal transduction histidine kinase
MQSSSYQAASKAAGSSPEIDCLSYSKSQSPSDTFYPVGKLQESAAALARHSRQAADSQTEEATRDAERFGRAIVDTLPGRICVLDETGRMVVVNKAWRNLDEATPLAPPHAAEAANYLAWCEAATGPNAHDARAFASGIRAVISGERDTFSLEYASHADEQRWFVGRITCFSCDGSRYLLIAHEDISERTWAEQALRKAIDAAEAAQQQAKVAEREEEQRHLEAERRRQIAESLREVLSLLNSNRPLTEVLDYIVSQARGLLGSQAAALYCAPPETGEVVVQAARGLSSYYLSSARASAGQRAAKPVLLTPWPVSIPDIAAIDTNQNDPGLEIQDLMLLAPPAAEYRALLAVPVLVKDEIYGRLRLYYRAPRQFSEEDAELAVLFSEQVALAIENARLREQVKQGAILEERHRLARDLHDAVTQSIFSANLIAEALPRIWKQRPAEALCGLEELHRLTRGALAETRTLLLELRPAAITEKKLGELLKQLAEMIASQRQIPVTLSVEGDEALPADVQIAFYRIVQEALNNAMKHAKASHITVKLQYQGEKVVAWVRDNGRGFQPNAIRPDQLGVNIMRERAQDIGATFELTSQAEQGTQVLVTWAKAGRGIA